MSFVRKLFFFFYCSLNNASELHSLVSVLHTYSGFDHLFLPHAMWCGTLNCHLSMTACKITKHFVLLYFGKHFLSRTESQENYITLGPWLITKKKKSLPPFQSFDDRERCDWAVICIMINVDTRCFVKFKIFSLYFFFPNFFFLWSRNRFVPDCIISF